MAVTTEVAVIGGGAIGLCTARALQRRGREVTVIEEGRFGGQCSTGNAGLVVPSHVVPLAAPGVIGQGLRWLLRRDSPFRIKPRFDLGLLHWLWRFYRACTERHVERSIPLLRDLSLESRALYEEWARSYETDLGFRDSGLLMLHSTENGREEVHEEAEQARAAGLEVQALDREGVEEKASSLPSSVEGGVYYTQDGMLTPTRLIEALEEELSDQENTTLSPGVGVTGFEHENGSINAIQTTSGRVKADTIVLAAGAWAAPLGDELGLDVPIEPAKGYSVTVEVPSGRPETPFILTEEKVSVTPMGEQVRFAGTLELAGFDASVDPYRVSPILDVANEYDPSGGPVSPDTVDPWVGFRPCTPDGLPIIGPVAQYDNLIMATGHCMLGMSLAPVTGRLVAETIEHESPTVDLAPLRLGRFH